MNDTPIEFPTRRSVLAAGTALLAFAAIGPALSATSAPAEVSEKDVTITTPDGQADAALFSPAGKGRWPAVIFWHDLGGLRIGRRQLVQGLIEIQELIGKGYFDPILVTKLGALVLPAPTLAPLAAGLIDQDAPHRRRGGREEMAAAIPGASGQ